MSNNFRYLFLLAGLFLIVPSITFANGLAGGKYLLTDGQVPFVLDVMPNPDGKLFLVGSGNLQDGRGCRVGDLAEIKGGQLIVGACKAGITILNNGFQLNDSNNCFQCVTGLSASGTYKKQ
jgi:hypothetical protein